MTDLPSSTGVTAYVPAIVSTFYALPILSVIIPQTKITNIPGIYPGPYDPFGSGPPSPTTNYQ